MNECLFCRIAAREIPSRTVHEDARVFAFEDIAPKAPTHVLVVPKKHIGRLAEAGSDDTAVLGELAARAAAIARERGLSDYRIVINNGEGAGQSVFHLHLHLLGGRPFSWPPG
jgi:histidine triad (HIT) family protein